MPPSVIVAVKETDDPLHILLPGEALMEIAGVTDVITSMVIGLLVAGFGKEEGILLVKRQVTTSPSNKLLFE